MSEPTNESPDTSEPGRITDDQLPDDLNPDENPLAAEPDDDDGAAPGGPGGPGGLGGAGGDLGAGTGQPG
jgi:hypothetical protein